MTAEKREASYIIDGKLEKALAQIELNLILLEVYLKVCMLQKSPFLHLCKLLTGQMLLVGYKGFEVGHEHLGGFLREDDRDRAEDTHDYVCLWHLGTDKYVLEGYSSLLFALL